MSVVNVEESNALKKEDNWYTTPTTQQRLLNSQGLRERLAEVKTVYKNEQVLLWGKRSKEKLEDAIYIIETSGRVKACLKCGVELLQWNPMDKELCCTDCGEIITESESKRMQTAIARGISANGNESNGSETNGKEKRKYERRISVGALDPSFADPKTWEEKYSESARESKREYASAQIIALLAKMNLRLGSPQANAFLKFATEYSKQYYYQKERKDEILEALKKVNDKIQALNSGLDLFDEDEEKKMYEAIILKAIAQKEALEKELENF